MVRLIVFQEKGDHFCFCMILPTVPALALLTALLEFFVSRNVAFTARFTGLVRSVVVSFLI
jgi:hypothetical protein